VELTTGQAHAFMKAIESDPKLTARAWRMTEADSREAAKSMIAAAQTGVMQEPQRTEVLNALDAIMSEHEPDPVAGALLAQHEILSVGRDIPETPFRISVNLGKGYDSRQKFDATEMRERAKREFPGVDLP
jgi:hypothetical protein